MEVARLYKAPKNWPVLSAETCPTHNHKSIEPVLATVETLLPVGIRVITTNWGATDSARGGSTSLCRIIRDRYDIPTVVHLSIQGKSRREIEGILRGMHLDGLHNVLALGGEPPGGLGDYVPEDLRHRHARDLVEQIANMNRGKWLDRDGGYDQSGVETEFGVGVAGFPEVHPEDYAVTGDFASGLNRHLDFLKRKIDAGADYVIEQMIFDADLHFNFVAKARAAGIQVPIIPGILPFERLDQVERFLGDRLRISMPPDLTGALRGLCDEDQAEVATEYMSGQVRTLLEAGVPGIHFYCMNRAEPTVRVLERARS